MYIYLFFTFDNHKDHCVKSEHHQYKARGTYPLYFNSLNKSFNTDMVQMRNLDFQKHSNESIVSPQLFQRSGGQCTNIYGTHIIRAWQ